MNPREVASRLLNLIKIARVTMVDDSRTAQTLQVKLPSVGADGNPLAEYPRLAEFGFSSRPPIGSDAAVVALWGNRTAGLVVATNHQPSRPTGLGDGDAQVYSVRGQRVWLAVGSTVHDGGGLPIAFCDYGETATFDAGLTTTGPLAAGNGWTGTFKTGDGRVATVLAGIVTAVV